MTFSEDDERQLAAFMARLSAVPGVPVVRDPSFIWWKAQMLKQWDADRRVAAPLDLMQPIELAAGLACVAFFLYRALPAFL